MTTDPAIAGAVLTEDDLPERYRNPHDLRENLQAGQRALATIPSRYADATATVPEVVAWVRQVVEIVAAEKAHSPRVHSGPSLLLVGRTGSGKTHQAYGALRALSVSGAACDWLSVTAADLYAELRPRPRIDPEDEFRRFARASVLVLDDLGAAKGSEWTEEINYRLVNHRYEREMPTLITSNVDPTRLAAALGERVASRLMEMATQVVIKGADRRVSGKGAA